MFFYCQNCLTQDIQSLTQDNISCVSYVLVIC
nr:MAG TPA: hypothetical protein [Caudoviricetes sp.]